MDERRVLRSLKEVETKRRDISITLEFRISSKTGSELTSNDNDPVQPIHGW